MTEGPQLSTDAPVLAAVDFSEDSRAALIWGAEYASRIDTPLVVLHVLHDPLDDPGFYRKDNKDPSTPMADIAADMLQQFVADSLQERPDLTILGRALLRLVKGVPSNRILEVAADIEAQHIVLGRKGRSNLKELVVGSTTRAVTQKSPLPVTSLRAPVSEPVADISDGETE